MYIVLHLKLKDLKTTSFLPKMFILACPWEEVRYGGHFSWEGTIKRVRNSGVRYSQQHIRHI